MLIEAEHRQHQGPPAISDVRASKPRSQAEDAVPPQASNPIDPATTDLAVAELRRAKAAAEAANEAKSRYLVAVSHEIRSPLNAIYGYAQLLERGDAISGVEAGAAIRRSVDHLTSLAESLLELSHVESGVLKVQSDVVDIRALLEQITSMFRAQAMTKGLDLRLEISGRLPPLVKTDQKRLKQVLINLVSNAIKYTDAGSIDVHFARTEKRLDISVIDTGPGIPREQLPLIFQEFTQLDSSSTRRFDGAGMGLAVVRGLVDLLDGKIEVSSEVGQGAAFRVSLPAVSAEHMPERGEQEADAPELRKARVLVIDDHEAIRDSLTEMLTHLGYSAVALPDVDSALAWLRANDAHVILADLHMPGKDGYSFANEYRARSAPGASVPIIAVSAYAPELVDPAAAVLFFDYLLKPVRYEVLKGAVHRAVTVRRRVT